VAAAKGLRVVKDGEKGKRKAHTVASAAAEGDELDLQYAMRDRLATAITGDCPPRDLAALTRRLEDVMERIKVLEATQVKEARADRNTGDEAFDASAI
jgi:hypothetical protein